MKNQNELDRAAEIFARFVAEMESGGEMNPEALYDAHPNLEPELRRRFEAYARLKEILGDPVTPEPERGHRLGDFCLLREINRGGMGIVYEARHLKQKRNFALKILSPAFLSSEHAVKRFHREAAAIAKLNHPNIIPVLEVSQEREIHYFTMEYVHGVTLEKILAELQSKSPSMLTGLDVCRVVEGTVSEEDDSAAESPPRRFRCSYMEFACRTGLGVARALEHAHSNGIIHRDVKPSNIFITREGVPKLFDFGLARDVSTTTITVEGEFLGTPCYVAPEQVEGPGKRIDERADVYSLGATLYQMAALKPPFEGDDAQRVLRRILIADPLPLRRVNPQAPRDLENIVRTCMEKRPEHRYQNAARLAEDLQAFLHSRPVRAKAEGPLRLCKKWIHRHRIAALAGTALIVILLLASWQGARFKQLLKQEAFETGRTALEEGNYGNAFRRFMEIYERFPGSEEYEAARSALEERLRSALAQPEEGEVLALYAVMEAERKAAALLVDEVLYDDLCRCHHALVMREQFEEFEKARKAFDELEDRLWHVDQKFISENMTPVERKNRLALVEEKEKYEEDHAFRKLCLVKACFDALDHARRKGPSGNRALNLYLAEISGDHWVLSAGWGEREIQEKLGEYLEIYDEEGRIIGRMNPRIPVSATSRPEGAEVYLFKYLPHGRVSPGDGLDRLVPVPVRRVPQGAAPAWNPGEEFYPGDLCLEITHVAGGSAAMDAGVEEGDLVLRIGPHPAGSGVFVAEVLSDPAFLEGVMPYDRLLEINGREVHSLYDVEWGWPDEKDPADTDIIDVVVEGAEGRIILNVPWREVSSEKNWKGRLEHATGMTIDGPSGLLKFPASERGVVVRTLHRGKPEDLFVPPDEISGITARITAYPLVFGESSFLGDTGGGGLRFEVDHGSYLLVMRLSGYEDLRLPFHVPFTGHHLSSPEKIHGALLPEGRTPSGFVWVVPGPFLWGGDKKVYRSRPLEKKHLDGYWIAVHEATCREYMEFLNDPAIRERIGEGRREIYECTNVYAEKDILLPPRDFNNPLGLWEVTEDGEWIPQLYPWGLDVPVMGVTLNEIQEYIKWLNKRDRLKKLEYFLPDDMQWEKAARGADGRSYPWGEFFDWSLAKGKFSRDLDEWTPEWIMRFHSDESVYGIRDMAGGVQEWTASSTVRGGSWNDSNPAHFRCAYYKFEPPNRYMYSFGFRLCVRMRN